LKSHHIEAIVTALSSALGSDMDELFKIKLKKARLAEGLALD
jgi:hypothetical protein